MGRLHAAIVPCAAKRGEGVTFHVVPVLNAHRKPLETPRTVHGCQQHLPAPRRLAHTASFDYTSVPGATLAPNSTPRQHRDRRTIHLSPKRRSDRNKDVTKETPHHTHKFATLQYGFAISLTTLRVDFS
eukprot:scaffold34288_cov129-Isochrysis_galbana.AAC.2